MLVMQRPTVEALGEETNNRSDSPSARSSPASATRSATRCAAPCCRRSPVPPSPTVRFDDALHEFDTINGVAEDVTDIILNFKDIVLTSERRRGRHVAPRRAWPGRGHRRRHRVPRPTSRSSTRTSTSPPSTARPAWPSTSPSSRAAATPRASARPRSRTIGVIPIDAIFSPGAPRQLRRRADPRRAVDQLRQPGDRDRDRRFDHARATRWPRPAPRCARWSTSSPA